MLKNLKLGTKLIIGLSAIATVALAIAVVAMLNLRTLANADTKLYQARTLPMHQLGEMATDFEAMRRASRDLLMATTAAQVEQYSQSLKEPREQFAHGTELCRTCHTNEEGRKMLRDFEGTAKPYDAYLSQVIELKRAGKDKEALSLFNRDEQKAAENVESSIAGFREAKMAVAQGTADENSALARRANLIMLGGVLVGLALVVGIGVPLTRCITGPIKQVETTLSAVAAGDLTQNLEFHCGDEIGGMADSIRAAMDYFKGVAAAVEKLGQGNVTCDLKAKSERDVLGQSVNRTVESVRAFVGEMHYMSQQHDLGDIDVMMPEQKFEGAFRDMAKGVNDMVKGHITVKKKAMACVAEFGKGNFEAPLERFPGKKAFINETIEQVRTNLLGVSREVNDLADAIVNGRLATRGNAGAFCGDWRKMVEAINSLIEAFVKPVAVFSGYIARIGKGDIPPNLTEIYNGDFNTVKDSFNACIDGLGGLVEANQVLQRMAVNDYSTEVEGSYQGIFAEVATATNGALGRVRHAVEVLAKVAEGDYRDKLDELVKVGKRSENDTFVPAFIAMMQAIDTMVADAKMLAHAGAEGKLSTRADASRHRGEYRNVIEGVNQTLDAVIGPLNVAASYVDQIGKGVIPVKITGRYEGDFAVIKDNLNSCIDGLAGLAEANRVLQRMAANDYTNRVEGAYQGIFNEVATATNTVADTLSASIGAIGQNSQALASSAEQLTAVSQQMSSTAEETAAQSSVVSAATEQVTKNLQTVATATEEMTSSIKEIAKNSSEAARVATAAVKTAETTNTTVAKLGQASNEIGQVIKVITSIAQQTNLLALNATIEAARAGEAGKGFAVVANEVKELAKETAKATEDITQKIEAIQADTKGAVDAIGEISAVITQINDISNTIASAVEEQTATTNEIARNVAEAAEGGKQVGQNIEAVATAARSTTRGAADTQNAASELARMAAELQTLVGQFKLDGAGISRATQPQRRPRVRAA